MNRNKTLTAFAVLLVCTLLSNGGAVRADEMEDATKTIGPEGGDASCANCHANEAEAWKQTRHFATFKDRHRSEEAKAILANLGIKSMKRDGDCKSCHYTSAIVTERLRQISGVSCESCHSPGLEWNDIHNKIGGDPAGQTLKWGAGKSESAEAKAARLDKAKAAGMIHSSMTYEIATNCFSCHTVPNEELVNKGGHKAGSDFDLVAWSQGEVRHNFVSSPGAPDSPTNRETTPEQKRRLYVVGAMVDLEVSLRNLSSVKEKGGEFHKAMVARVAVARKKVDSVLAAVADPGLSAALTEVPASVDESTMIDAGLADKLSSATRKFAASSADLSAIDGQLPKEFKGQSQP
jgi:hypothetical protein